MPAESLPFDPPTAGLAYAWGKPAATGRMRDSPEDFQVTEIPLLAPDGDGEHVWLWIRKRNENTLDVAARLARYAGVHPRQVSFAGLKDRYAVTAQWFSVQLPGKNEPLWENLNSATLTVLRHARHSRKLRRGALQGNTFRITLRDITGESEELERRLGVIAAEGVPNYFGEQRFGRHGSNLQAADRLFRNPKTRLSRNKRSLILSAARALLFNQVLSARVDAGTWNTPLGGDAMQLDGSHSYFIADSADAELAGRVACQDIHPTGPLYGRGENPAQGACRMLEAVVLAEHASWCAGLEAAGLQQDRRALRLRVTDLAWQRKAFGELQLTFTLPAGAYATSVLRELVQTSTATGG
jgi:tRNA pseudouridine13 synthase